VGDHPSGPNGPLRSDLASSWAISGRPPDGLARRHDGTSAAAEGWIVAEPTDRADCATLISDTGSGRAPRPIVRRLRRLSQRRTSIPDRLALATEVQPPAHTDLWLNAYHGDAGSRTSSAPLFSNDFGSRVERAATCHPLPKNNSEAASVYGAARSAEIELTEPSACFELSTPGTSVSDAAKSNSSLHRTMCE
jgi:hypothetical protein